MNQSEAQVSVEVEDFGSTTDLSSVKGVGLLSMQQRIDLLSGTFVVGAKPTGGILVQMKIPSSRV
jgi:signal transduction histidine kinase